ncbi:MAG: arylsulfatase [Thermoleophilia bacterium]|nr:arylsulfatase [Thermoleophilia bacterium]
MADSKPNILVLWGDDIGWYNISHNNRGAMGYQTPNIDRLAHEGIEFTDYYGQQSCTAGRAAFITGQNPLRTGLTKVGMPGATVGLQPEDPTIAELLKPLGYATGQFGKNHLGDSDEMLPSNHGFDEFYGNLYHLNAEDEPEHPDYPKDPAFRERFGPRGVIHSFADGRIEDTGPLTKKRMETIDDDVTDRAEAFIRQAHAAGAPFFVWWNATHMHLWTRIPEEAEGISGQGFYNDAMVLHDRHVGRLLDLLDELGITGNTIVVYSTDNGPHYNTWPDGAISPWRSEKNSNWEGAYRVPCFARWPGRFPAGTVLNGIVTHQEWLPTLLDAAGEPDIVRKLRAGHQAGDKHFHVHIDGYDCLSYFTGETEACPRQWFFYANDDGTIVAIRYGDWKAVFYEQRAKTLQLWAEPFVPLRLPKLFHLRRDPFERADENSNGYWNWVVEHVFVIYPMQALAAEQIESFREFPPRQKPAAFNLDAVLEKMQEAGGGGLH